MSWLRRAIVASGSIACAVGVATAPSAGVSQPIAGTPRGGKVIGRIRIPTNSGVLAAGEGAIWTTADAVPTLLRIDPRSDSVVARRKIPSKHPCPDLPGSCGEATVGVDAVWIARTPDDTVLRVDPRTTEVTATIPVGSRPEGIAATRSAVWVVNKGGPSVSRIDPATNRVVATIRIAAHGACCSDHMAITAGVAAVWATVPSLNMIVGINPATNTVTARIRLSGTPCAALAADARTVWAAGGHCVATVMRAGARTKKQGGSVKGFLAAPIGLAMGFGSLWVVDLDAKTVFRVDPRSGRIAGRLPVGGQPVRVAVGFGSVWIRDDAGRVLRIKPTP